jgi:two-component system nitrate/nitrite response regulator NarL
LNPRKIRIVVADAHPLFALGLRVLLSAEPGLEVVGDTSDGKRTIELVQRLKPDFLLLDLAIEGVSGLEVLRRLLSSKSPTQIVVVASDPKPADLRLAFARGARGVMPKATSPSLLVKCVRQVMAGQFWISRDSVGDLVHALAGSVEGDGAGSSAVSNREREIVRGVIKGASNKDIGVELGLSEQTIKNHLRRIFWKFGVTNRVELAVKATGKT